MQISILYLFLQNNILEKSKHLSIYLFQCFIVIILGITCYFTISNYYQKNQEKLTFKIVDLAMSSVEQLLTEKGLVNERNGLLYAGDFLLNNSKEIVEKIYENTGFGCTIFQQNKRISTTAMVPDESMTAKGTEVNDEISTLVYQEGKIFEGVIETIGKKWIVQYKPLRDSNNQIVGMIAVFQEYDAFLGYIWMFKYMVASAMLICCSIVILIMRVSYRTSLKLDNQSQTFNHSVNMLSEQQEQLKKLSIVAEEVTQNVSIIGKDDKIEWVNPAFLATYGFNLEEVIGRKMSHLIAGPETDNKAVEVLDDYIFNYKKPHDLTLVQYRKDKSSLWAKVLVSPILDSNGQLEKYISISHDITDEYEAIIQLQKVKNQFSEIGRTIEDVFYLYNIIDQKYEYISPKCEHILGVSSELFYAGESHTKMVVHADDKSKVSAVQHIVEGGEPYDIDFRVIIDSEIRWIRERSYPIFDDQGKVIKSSGLCIDITESKNIKKELETSNLHTKLLAEIGLEITECRSIEEIVNNLYARVNQLMDAFGFSIGVINKEKNELRFPLFIEQDETILDAIHNLDENVLGCICANTGKDIIIQDPTRDYSKYTNQKLDYTGGVSTQSLIYLPLIINKKTVGVLTVQSREKNAYSNHQINLLKNLNAYLSNGIENILLNTSLEEQVKERTEEIVIHKNKLIEQYESNFTLSEIGVSLSSSLDFESIFDTLHNQVMKMMDAEMFGIRILNLAKNCVEYKYEVESDFRHPSVDVSMDKKNNYTIWAIDHKKSIFISDNLKEYSKYVSAIDTPVGKTSNSLIFCPMIVEGDVLGVITVQSFDKNAYTEAHLNSVKSLAFYAGIALSNAGLLDTLEARVKKRTFELSKKNQEITDSIYYTKRIQDATLTSTELRKDLFPDSFVIYKPKDIISGDFFIFNSIMGADGSKFNGFIVGDCTGHGVPGASLAILCSSMLNQTFSESTVNTPAQALIFARNRLQKLFNSSDSKSIKDGMDVGFGVIKESTNELYYSGALMDCLILRNGEWITIKGNRFHVGHSAELIPFTNHHIQLQKGDQIFLASDGVIDQFGGEFNKKFMRKRFLATIENNNTGSMEKIGAVISEALAVWQGKSEQTDDICALGIRV